MARYSYYPDTFYRPQYTPVQIQERIKPLLDQMRRFDESRVKLQQKGGRVGDLRVLKDILTEPLAMLRHTNCAVKLTDRNSIRHYLQDLGAYSIHIEARKVKLGLPAWYVCRTESDAFGSYGLIVQDLHVSPDYPMTENRFVKLMRHGHEKYYLRMSHFREPLGQKAKEWKIDIDRTLYSLGRYVFQATWHDDQRIVLAVADNFGLNHFRQATEFLYFCLTGEFCEVRNRLKPEMISFFEEVYENTGIADMLRILPSCEGGALGEFPKYAMPGYRRLARALCRFMVTQVPWSGDIAPLYRLILANMDRIAIVRDVVAGNPALASAKEELESEASSVIQMVLAEMAPNSVAV